MRGRVLIFAVLVPGLLLWLMLAERPIDRRIGGLNRAIRSGELGRIPGPLQERLQAQVNWLAVHAGVGAPVEVNGPIVRGRLGVVVTRPAHERLTGCGAGNAIYDPALDAIFIDESILMPIDLASLGEASAHTMVDANSLGFAVSYLNFIIAHELGHRQRHARGSAFFHYGLQGAGAADMTEEREADRFAVETIERGYRSGDLPKALEKLNSLDRVGLSHATLSSADRAAGDIMGAMVTMSIALLFSSSPYSPYYSDASHPNFLQRAEEAIRSSSLPTAGQALAAHNPVVRAQLERIASLSRARHREVFFPKPVHTADVRDGRLWLGCYSLPRPGSVAAVGEHLYHVSLDQILPGRTADRAQVAFQLAASGVSPPDSLPGAWIEKRFEEGDARSGLPAPSTPDEPRPTRLFRKSDRFRGGLGLEFAGKGWEWDDPVLGSVQVSEPEIRDFARRKWGYQEVKFGSFRRIKEVVAAPILAEGADHQPVFQVLLLSGPDPDAMTSHRGFVFQPPDGHVMIDGARFWEDAWWVVVRTASEPRKSDLWQLWRIEPSGRAELHAEAPLLYALAGDQAEGNYLRDIDPSLAFCLATSGRRLLVGLEQDSLYAIDPGRKGGRVLFHPLIPQLRVLDLGRGLVLFWIRNGHKAFVVDTITQGSSS